MKYFIFISFLAICHCRPQDSVPNSGVEVEKQTIISLQKENERLQNVPNEEEKRRAEITRDILQKIAEVNLNHGLTPKKIRRPVVYSSHKPHQLEQQQQQPKQLPNFQFSNTPFTNPIFDYLQNQKPTENNFVTKSTFSDSNNDDIPEGYTIKRKVTHHQIAIIPGYQQPSDSYHNPMYPGMPVMNNQYPINMAGGNYGLVPINEMNSFNPTANVDYSEKPKIDLKNKTLDELTLAKQNFLINNIKNIISHSQNPQEAYSYYAKPLNPYIPMQNPYYTPYQQPMPYSPDPYNYLRTNPYLNPYAIPPNYIHPNMQPNPISNQKFTDTYYANLQAEKEPEGKKLLQASENNENVPQSGRQLQGPFSQYFPIVIKNPFQQMVQAFTSMIEYGPSADLCRSHHGDDINNKISIEDASHRSDATIRSGKSIVLNKPSIDIIDKDSKSEVVVQKVEEITEKSEDNDFYIEGLKIVDNNQNVSKKQNGKKPDPEKREMEEEEGMLYEEDKFFQKPARIPAKEDMLTPPGYGNGIFIQKLKVRKGGVAIAGPGGIATAGSGGTAVVGPNGFAYTQPNGVAIAGPGSRVISVDPNVNLNEFIQNITKDGTFARIGKVVAIGPVVYHNLGQD